VDDVYVWCDSQAITLNRFPANAKFTETFGRRLSRESQVRSAVVVLVFPVPQLPSQLRNRSEGRAPVGPSVLEMCQAFHDWFCNVPAERGPESAISFGSGFPRVATAPA